MKLTGLLPILLGFLTVGQGVFNRQVAERWGGDADIALYEGFYHELFNEPEPDRQRVLAELLAWLDDLELPA